MECQACGHVSRTYECCTSLTLEVSARVASLEAALQRFAATERLDGENKCVGWGWWAAVKMRGLGGIVWRGWLAAKAIMQELASLQQQAAGRSTCQVPGCLHASAIPSAPYLSTASCLPGSAPLPCCRYKCDACSARVAADKYTRIEVAPHYLQVCLKRFAVRRLLC